MSEKLAYKETKKLANVIHGIGEVRGVMFTKIAETEKGYIYKAERPEGVTYYEVFIKRINTRFNTESYPKSKSFGVWAWTYPHLVSAVLKLQEISNE